MIIGGKLLLSFFLGVGLVNSEDPNWQTGKVLDSWLDRKYAQLQVGTGTVRGTRLWIVGDVYAYLVAKPSRFQEHRWMTTLFGPRCRLQVGEDVKYLQKKAKLHLLDSRGNGCKVQIVRGEQLGR
jgi:hypothetical protein